MSYNDVHADIGTEEIGEVLFATRTSHSPGNSRHIARSVDFDSSSA